MDDDYREPGRCREPWGMGIAGNQARSYVGSTFPRKMVWGGEKPENAVQLWSHLLAQLAAALKLRVSTYRYVFRFSTF